MPRAAVDEYPERRASRARLVDTLNRQDALIARARLTLFGLGVALAVLIVRGVLAPWWLALPVVAFAAVMKRHEAVIRRRDAAARLVQFYERGLARLEDRWIGGGATGEQFLDPAHPYAADLDLFGRGSLFELLSLARTRAGEATLAAWLTRPAGLDTIAARHGAVAELRTALDLRESLALAGATVRRDVHPDALADWAGGPISSGTAWWLAGVALTIALPLLVAAAWQTGWLTPLVVAALLRAVYQQVEGPRIERLVRRADGAAHDLHALGPALELLERQTFASPLITALQADLGASGTRASQAIRVLVRYIEMHDWAHNIVFTPIAALVMWDTHLAWAIERWRRRHGARVAGWLQIVGEFEALSSLAAYSYEHPDDPFPALVDTSATDAALFDGIALGHPLLPQAQTVRNDVRLGGDAAHLLVVSGSNMSGKSTLLRTVGINAVLALAGAPVRARSLRLSPMAIGATLRIQDSLQEGRSRFFAEITRLRDIAATATAQPLLFLLDELFHGTNSHDRLVGAIGVLRSLLDRGAIGMITTHDLALTAITRELGPRAANAHFEDSFDGAEIRFDYRLKPGPVTRSNALALMRAVGLDVREDAQ